MELLAHLTIADHVAAVGGKLYINGGGWAVRPPQPVPWALALELKVAWHDNNRRFPYQLDLLDADGQPVEVDTPEGKKPLSATGEMRLTAGPGLRPGSQIVGLAAMLIPPIALPGGAQFEWRLSIDGETREEWRVAFATSDAPAQTKAA